MSEQGTEKSLTEICDAVAEALDELIHCDGLLVKAQRKKQLSHAIEDLMLMLLIPAGPMEFRIVYDHFKMKDGTIETSRETTRMAGETLQEVVAEFKQLHPNDLLNSYIIQEVEPL